MSCSSRLVIATILGLGIYLFLMILGSILRQVLSYMRILGLYSKFFPTLGKSSIGTNNEILSTILELSPKCMGATCSSSLWLDRCVGMYIDDANPLVDTAVVKGHDMTAREGKEYFDAGVFKGAGCQFATVYGHGKILVVFAGGGERRSRRTARRGKFCALKAPRISQSGDWAPMPLGPSKATLSATRKGEASPSPTDLWLY